jgi:hypothetical protein
MFLISKFYLPEAEVKKVLIEQEDRTGLPGWEKKIFEKIDLFTRL